MTPSSEPVAEAIAELRAALDGRVITPDASEYDDARTVFYGGVDRRPAAIVRPSDAAQVAQVVSAARESGAPLAVRSGGHSVAGHSVCDAGIVLDLGAMRGLEIDPGSGTAWAETGLTAGEYTNAAGEHGLTTGFGDTASVGIGGITLGGGVGYLSRAHGLTIDDLLAVEVVTARGEIVAADADTHPDLFWAIRGGGGNFGVATRLRFRLHELPSVVGGILLLPASAEVVRGAVAEALAAPDELSAIFNVMPAPPMPFVPAERHGELVVMCLVCYAGAAGDGERAVAPLRALATPIADTIAPIPYPQMYPPEQEGFHPTAVSRTMFVDGIDDAAAEAIIEALATSDAPMRVTQLRVLGGAISRVPAAATAYAHRASRIMVNVAAFYERPEEIAERQGWVDALAAAMRQDDDGAYVNFLGDEGPERVRAAYPPGTWERLAEIKARYDPTNLFRLNQNIPPAG
ncbi:MAG TPA: FAD-binding oxidoreductase [Solirubrobacterales bacterium]|nr:FAD-binding oxidoreductase [Solirubrobacterales bacterium]